MNYPGRWLGVTSGKCLLFPLWAKANTKKWGEGRNRIEMENEREVSQSIRYKVSLKGIYENLWASSHCHPQTVISVICYYQHFSGHWFNSFFSNNRRIVACSPSLVLPTVLSSLYILQLCIHMGSGNSHRKLMCFYILFSISGNLQ